MEILMYLTFQVQGGSVDPELLRASVDTHIQRALAEGALTSQGGATHIQSVAVGIYDD